MVLSSHGGSPSSGRGEPSRPSHADDVTGKTHVLVVDDEAAIREVEALRLRRLGFDVTTCSSSTRALKAIEADRDRFDLLLVDQVMPELTGLEFTRIVRARGHSFPIVIVSGYSADLTSESANAAGADAVLWKPYRTAELRGVLTDVLGVDPLDEE